MALIAPVLLHFLSKTRRRRARTLEGAVDMRLDRLDSISFIFCMILVIWSGVISPELA
jgi:hypothetical protein